MMSSRILFVATVDYHFKAFHLPYMKWLKEHGWSVDIAASGKIMLPYTDMKFEVDIRRSPFHWSNLKAYWQLKKIIDGNDYQIIHCHTPLGGVLARLAAKKARKAGTKIIYTAHGFHFFKGAPLANWAVYYPIERYLSRHTDCLITINEEDFQLAVNHRFKAETIEHVHGVGVDTNAYRPLAEPLKKVKRRSFGYQPDDFLLCYAAEFNKNKNQQFLIRSMVHILKGNPNARLLLAGEGEMLESCRELAEKLGIARAVDFLGFRKDLLQLLPLCDIAVASSFREGLPVNVMESMACGLPVIASDNRGHRELISGHQTGWVICLKDQLGFAKRVLELAEDEALRKEIGRNARKLMEDKYSVHVVLEQKKQIYNGESEERGNLLWHSL